MRVLLEPLIRAAGVLRTAQQAGIHHSTLYGWLSGAIPVGSSRRRLLNEEQLERLADVLGQQWTLTPKEEAAHAGVDPQSGPGDQDRQG